MHLRQNILLLLLNEDNREIIKNTLETTSFNNSNLFYVDNIDEVSSQLILNKISVILFDGNPDDYTTIIQLVNSTPILFITDSLIKIDRSRNNNSKFLNYLPKTEITSFVLENCISNILEKSAIEKKVEKLENIQKDKFDDLLNNSEIGIYEIDPEGNFVIANKVFLNILGLDNFEELKKLNAFKPGISTNGTRNKLKELLLDNEKVRNFEDEWLKTDQTKIVVRENVIAKKDSKGNIEYYHGIVEDITDRRLVEVELLKNRTNVEKTDKLKSEFLCQISHEIRTPVNTLLSFASLLKEDVGSSISEDLSISFSAMDKAGTRIIRTIDLLVKMSELHTDNYEPEFKQNNISSMLEEIVETFTPLAKRKNLEIQLIKGTPDTDLIFDRGTMFDVFSNILDNAIKYTCSGQIKIYIKKSINNQLAVTILDTGIGISKEYIQNLFKPFSQETSGYTRKYDGNGLGLALAKEYCKLNKAEIFVSSEKNCGSSFTIIFN